MKLKEFQKNYKRFSYSIDAKINCEKRREKACVHIRENNFKNCAIWWDLGACASSSIEISSYTHQERRDQPNWKNRMRFREIVVDESSFWTSRGLFQDSLRYRLRSRRIAHRKMKEEQCQVSRCPRSILAAVTEPSRRVGSADWHPRGLSSPLWRVTPRIQGDRRKWPSLRRRVPIGHPHRRGGALATGSRPGDIRKNAKRIRVPSARQEGSCRFWTTILAKTRWGSDLECHRLRRPASTKGPACPSWSSKLCTP